MKPQFLKSSLAPHGAQIFGRWFTICLLAAGLWQGASASASEYQLVAENPFIEADENRSQVALSVRLGQEGETLAFDSYEESFGMRLYRAVPFDPLELTLPW